MENAARVLDGIVGHVRAAVQGELDWLSERPAEANWAMIEEGLEQLVAKFRSALLHAVASALGTGNCGSEIQCACGGWMKLVGNRTKTFLTTLGDLRLRRAYYWCTACGATRVPLDEQLDLVGQTQSVGVQLTTALVCALLPNGQGMNLLEHLKVPHVSVKESQRVTREVGQRALAERDEEARRWREDHVPPSEDVRRQVPERLAVLMDGTKAHTDGDWHEVKVGTFYPFDEEGEALGEKGCVATFESIEPFRALWDTEAQRWHLAEVPHVVALCDGAPWTWNTVAECCPEHTVELLDFYHASKHLWTLARAVWGEGAVRAGEWVEEQERRLLEGDLDAFFEALKRWAGKEAYAQAAGDELRYFESNRSRLRYAEALERGDPIGSGMVEAACKTIVCVREKQPGMRWRKDTAECIAHLRCIYFSNRWETFRRRMMTTRRQAA